MNEIGALLVGFAAGFGEVDPAYAMLAGIALGACATLALLRWTPSRREHADPLSGLFKSATLEDQLARITDPQARIERKDRALSAVRTRMFARQSKRAAAQRAILPHRAERYDHAAVLDHIAKVMRAGTHNDDHSDISIDASNEWEEVLLLPRPAKSEDRIANAA